MKSNKVFSTLIVILFLLPAAGFTQSLEPTSLETALTSARETGKKVLIDVYAEWCPYCERMHTEIYTENEVITAIDEHYYLVKINIESDEKVNYLGNEMAEKEFAQMLQSTNLPTTYFMNGDGELLGKQPGVIPADVFEDLLYFVGSNAFENLTFDEYRNRD
ncbi:MAG: thioredoxin fold domain-containing protein [Balneolaceae bacterium]